MATIPSHILDLLQDQFKHETSNHFRYAVRASWAKYRGFDGSGKYFDNESKGELKHAKKVKDYIELRNQELVISPFTYDDPEGFQYLDELYTSALKVEQDTTEKLNFIFTEALAAGDIQTVVWVQELAAYQSIEENEVQSYIDRIVSRGGGGLQVDAIETFREDISAAHDFDTYVAEGLED